VGEPGARAAYVVGVILLVWAAGATVARSAGIWIGVGGAAVLLGAALLAIDRPAVGRPAGRALLLGLATGAAMSLATVLVAPALRWLPGGAEQLAVLYAVFAELPPWVALLALVPIIAGEELVWRGAVHARCARRFGEVKAVPIGAALYAAAHAPLGSWILCLAAAGCGLVWAALAARTRGLAAPLVAHLTWDLVVLFVAPLSPR
jgi:uncharacterized protein